jgi:hypothetical protein
MDMSLTVSASVNVKMHIANRRSDFIAVKMRRNMENKWFGKERRQFYFFSPSRLALALPNDRAMMRVITTANIVTSIA